MIKLIEGILIAIRKSNLEIVLTREVFFRIFESGEALYANVVLIAYDVGALVKDIKASLKKEDGATKEFILRVREVGEKYRSSEGVYQFSFYSSSTLAFIPENNPQRQVYICEYESYAEATAQEFQRFQRRLFELKEQYGDAINTNDKEQINNFASAVENSVATACTNIMDKIQIEPGKYTLSLTVTYRQKGKYWPVSLTKKAVSTISFMVDIHARDLMRYNLNDYLDKRSAQFFLSKNDFIPAPTYTPVNIIELSSI